MAHDVVTGGGDANLARGAALVDALVAAGVRHACVSPGSRSTPIALALARHPRVELQVHLDERSSAFVALGIAKATGVPAIVACTSGTAAAGSLPVVIEASQARVPLILLTADRPPRLRGTGANQTIDQTELYGGYVRLFLEAQLDGDPGRWTTVGRDALRVAVGDPPGPVHVNVPFDEPLIPETGPRLPVDVAATESSARGGPTHDPDAGVVARAIGELGAERGVVVIGSTPSEPTGVLELADRLGWPVLAEPMSGARRPGRALTAGQHLIASPWGMSRVPEVVLQVGATPTTRTSQRFVASAERLIVVDRVHLDPDPEARAAWRLVTDPDAFASAALEALDHASPASDVWKSEWRRADEDARAALDHALDVMDEPFEGRIARDVAAETPDGGTLFVGNSMPVRDLDAFMATRDGLRVMANRGASGIDGLVSTTLGVASVTTGPTVALIGDLSLVYDAGALLWNGARGADAVFVVPNNDGGGVFSFTGHADLPEFERLFATPHGLDLAALATAARVAHERIEHASELIPALGAAIAACGVHVIQLPVDRSANVRRHAEVQRAVDEALA